MRACVRPCVTAHATGSMRADTQSPVWLDITGQSVSLMNKWRCFPELVQFYGFRSVEVLLDTPLGSLKNCAEAREVDFVISVTAPRSPGLLRDLRYLGVFVCELDMFAIGFNFPITELEMSSSFSFSRPTTTTDDLEDLYKTYGVYRVVILDLAGTTETPETVREGYCRAYLSFFHSCGFIFPVPEPILEILAELGLSLTQILPNFLRYLIAFLVRAREEGLSFGLSEFRQLVLVKRNQQNPGTFLVSPRPGRHVIEDIP
ncbi:hypothetical protein F2Q69_00034949 [Brassica cretica]|uniref:Uncharacterized protein n=1 Tax=Brassica cretica TaxID=69181 RepID=A0A8S9SNU1_BRACR|nr:hypothetical protein F2Q69_00034949 [Brassica cretica]